MNELGTGKTFLSREFGILKRALNSMFNNLETQVLEQLKSGGDSMKDAERFFFTNNIETMMLIENTVIALKILSAKVDIRSTYGYDNNRNYSASNDLESISKSMGLMYRSIESRITWIERNGKGVELLSCPQDISKVVNKLFFDSKLLIVLTSATLTNQNTGNYEDQYSYFVRNTAFPLSNGVLAEPKKSPFPYNEHAMIYYCNDLPHPRNEHEKFILQGVDRVEKILEISDGKALILFTSKSDMEEVYNQLLKRGVKYRVLMQQNGSSQDKVLEEFRKDVNSVLLGTGAFWEGISIEGKSLSNLIIFRLPFPVPDPVIDYKSKISTDPEMEVLVPEMIIKLKQGIGRLIRNFTDTGIVSIIDSRLKDEHQTKYHDVTWASLPINNRTTSLTELKEFYNKIKMVNNPN